MASNVQYIDKDDARRAVLAQGGERLHSFRGFVGCDWDVADVLEAIATAKQVAWVDNMFRHELTVQGPDDAIVRFDVQRPETPGEKGEGAGEHHVS